VQVPLRDAYIDYVTAHYPGVYRRYLELAHSIPGAQVKIFERASELGIPEDCFYDYGHLTIKGARIFTLALAGYLEQSEGGLFNTPGPPGPAP